MLCHQTDTPTANNLLNLSVLNCFEEINLNFLTLLYIKIMWVLAKFLHGTQGPVHLAYSFLWRMMACGARDFLILFLTRKPHNYLLHEYVCYSHCLISALGITPDNVIAILLSLKIDSGFNFVSWLNHITNLKCVAKISFWLNPGIDLNNSFKSFIHAITSADVDLNRCQSKSVDN